MKRARFKRRRKNILSYVVVLVMVVLTVLLGRSTWGIYQKHKISSEKRGEALEQLEELQERKEGLERELERLNTERGLEEEIRTKFQVSKPGEETIVLVEPESAGDNINEGPSLWERIKNIFR
jgi:cell division protein FtsB